MLAEQSQTLECPHTPKHAVLILLLEGTPKNKYLCCKNCTEKNQSYVDEIIELKEIKKNE